MSIKKSIFGSAGEAQGFHLIERTWGEDYKLFSNVSFSGIFDAEPEWRDTSNFFFKTSIDYVLCTKEGRFLIGIDFDGLGEGFDEGGWYQQVKKTPDPYRKTKFDFKLKYARKNGFPYHIVASDEFQNLDDDIALTIVDGIIGHELAAVEFRRKAENRGVRKLECCRGCGN